MSGAFQGAKYSILFDGQSLNYAPNNPLGGVNDYRHQLMVSFPHVTWQKDKNVGSSGVSWTTLATTAYRRLFPYCNTGLTNILIMCGGTSDIWDGDSGATVYSDMYTYSDNARTYGIDLVIACTITPNTVNSGAQETQRLDANSRIIADVSNKFDYSVAMAEDTDLDDASNLTYYGDGTHFTTLGATRAAAVVQTTLNSIISAEDR